LTHREQEVLEQLCTGASYREAAGRLGVAEGTVHTHVKRIYEKLGANTKAEAVRIALDSRLVALRYG
jgi:DNA-binding CsgD family transcriptional regulator